MTAPSLGAQSWETEAGRAQKVCQCLSTAETSKTSPQICSQFGVCWREGRRILNCNKSSSPGLHSQCALLTSDQSFKAQVTHLLLLQEAAPASPSPMDELTTHTHSHRLPLCVATAPTGLPGVCHGPLGSLRPPKPGPEQVLTSYDMQGECRAETSWPRSHCVTLGRSLTLSGLWSPRRY